MLEDARSHCAPLPVPSPFRDVDSPSSADHCQRRGALLGGFGSRADAAGVVRRACAWADALCRATLETNEMAALSLTVTRPAPAHEAPEWNSVVVSSAIAAPLLRRHANVCHPTTLLQASAARAARRQGPAAHQAPAPRAHRDAPGEHWFNPKVLAARSEMRPSGGRSARPRQRTSRMTKTAHPPASGAASRRGGAVAERAPRPGLRGSAPRIHAIHQIHERTSSKTSSSNT